MIKWCSYCQRYQGEIEPLEEYSITHGICQACRQHLQERRFDDHFLTRVRALSERIMTTAYDRSGEDVDGVLQAGRDIGMRPIDLVIGVLQPSLYKVGALWASGDITVEDEHRFTRFALSLVEKITAQMPAALVRAKRPLVLLARPEDNEHTLGLQFVALHLATRNISSRVLLEGITAGALLPTLREAQPMILGLSISMVHQFAAVREIHDAMRNKYSEIGKLPKLVVSGLSLRAGYQPAMDKSIEAFRDTHQFVEFCIEFCRQDG